MSLPTSFTLRPRVKAPLTRGGKPSTVGTHDGDDIKRKADRDASSSSSIQFTFSGQENEDLNETSLRGVKRREPPSTLHQKPWNTVHPDATAAAAATTSLFPPLERNPRRSIRVSPFQPMAHQRKMPRHGTISPLKVREYHFEQQRNGIISNHHHLMMNNNDCSSTRMMRTMCPPLDVVQIPGQSPTDVAGSDFTLSSPPTPATTASPGFTDYKTLYLQCQRELKALQKLQERTLEENHQLKSRIRTLSLRRRAESNMISLNGGADETVGTASVSGAAPLLSRSALLVPNIATSNSQQQQGTLASTTSLFSSAGRARAPTVRRERTTDAIRQGGDAPASRGLPSI